MNGPTIHKSSSTSRHLITEKSMGIFKAILTSLFWGQTFNYILKVYHILRHKGDEKDRRLDENLPQEQIIVLILMGLNY